MESNGTRYKKASDPTDAESKVYDSYDYCGYDYDYDYIVIIII